MKRLQTIQNALNCALTKSPQLPHIVLYCIVLYLYIYIAPLAVHTNQKRFQCERPREKRARIPYNRLPVFFIVLQSSSTIFNHVFMSLRPFANYAGFPHPNLPPDVPSLYKLISLLCFLICYTLFISQIQTSSTIFISS